jgi:hypothetical protein
VANQAGPRRDPFRHTVWWLYAVAGLALVALVLFVARGFPTYPVAATGQVHPLCFGSQDKFHPGPCWYQTVVEGLVTRMLFLTAVLGALGANCARLFGRYRRLWNG